MPISSMTGFARASGERQGLFWQWEIKSVNGKGLDVRCRAPVGFDAVEAAVRTLEDDVAAWRGLVARLSRGLIVSLDPAHVEAALDVTTHPLSYRPFDRFEHVALRLRDAVDARIGAA
jgi:hypothetical protein